MTPTPFLFEDREVSRRVARRVRAAAQLTLACLLALPLAAQAFELGPLRIDAKPDQPLQGEIALKGPVDASGLKAWIATQEAHRAAGLTPLPSLQGVRLTPQRGPKGDYVLKLEGVPASLKVFDMLIIATDPKDVVLGEYRIDIRGAQREFAAAPIGSKLPLPGGTASAGARQPAAASASPPAATAAASAPPPGAAAAAPAPEKVAAAPATPAPPPPAAPAGAAPAAADRLAQAKSAIEAWAQAWSRRDVDAYVAAYVPDYAGRTPGRSRDDWIKERTERIQPRSSISVEIARLKLTDQKDSVVATFAQTYRSDGMLIRSRKTLTLVPSKDGGWLISSETEG